MDYLDWLRWPNGVLCPACGWTAVTAALGMVAPWQVTSVEFDKDAGELQIGLGFPRGSRFPCPVQGCRQSACVVHDTLGKRWRHLDFFEHRAFLTARVPRVECGQHGVHLVEAVSYTHLR